MAGTCSALFLAVLALSAFGVAATGNSTENSTSTLTTTSYTTTSSYQNAPAPAPAPAPSQVEPPSVRPENANGDKLVEGTVSMTVNDVATFIQSAEAKVGVAKGIADAAGVPASYVFVELSAGRRLKAKQQIRRLASGSVNVAYTITIPASDSLSITSVKTAITSTSTADMSNLIQNSVSNEGLTVTVTVSAISTPTTQVVRRGIQNSFARSQFAPAPVHFLALALPLAWLLA